MRPGPATPAASSVDLPTRLIRHSRGGMMLLARQRPRGSAAFAKAGCTRDLATTKRNRCGGRQPIPTHERDRGGGRNARATSFAFARVSDMSPGDSPSRITGCCRPCRNHPASSENSHVFAAPTVSQNPAARNKKTTHACAKTVDEMPSLWKPEENRERFKIISAFLRIKVSLSNASMSFFRPISMQFDKRSYCRRRFCS
jgi:hypothetical protein